MDRTKPIDGEMTFFRLSPRGLKTLVYFLHLQRVQPLTDENGEAYFLMNIGNVGNQLLLSRGMVNNAMKDMEQLNLADFKHDGNSNNTATRVYLHPQAGNVGVI